MKRHLFASAAMVALFATTPNAFAIQEHHEEPTGQQTVVGQPSAGQTGQDQGWMAPGATGTVAMPMMALVPGVQAPGGGCMVPMMPMMGQGGMAMMGAMMPMMGQGGMSATGQGMAVVTPGSPPAMSAMGARSTGLGRGIDRIEGRIAFLRAEIGITDVQGPSWDAFAQAVRNAAAHIAASGTPTNGTGSPVNVTQVLENQDAALDARLQDVKALHSTLAGLYEVLSEDQKKTAEDLIPLVIGTVIAG
jgi:hypothetical protein